MNPDLCFEYQQLMLRHDKKNKALTAEEKKLEMRVKQLKHHNKDQQHKQDENKQKTFSMVFENDNVVKMEEKMEEKKKMNSKVANKNQINKQLFKLLNNVAKHKKPAAEEEPVMEAEEEPVTAAEEEPVTAAEEEPATAAEEPVAKIANKNMNISKIHKAFSSKKKQ